MLEFLDPEILRMVAAGAGVGALTATLLSLVGLLERVSLDQPSHSVDDKKGDNWLPRPVRAIAGPTIAGAMIGWYIADRDDAVFYIGLIVAGAVIAHAIWQIANLDTGEGAVGEVLAKPDPDEFFETAKGRAWGELAFGLFLLWMAL